MKMLSDSTACVDSPIEDEYPRRDSAELRIKPKSEILKLKNPEVRIETSNLCNYHCVMCPRETLSRPKGLMPFDFFKSIVDEVKLMGAEQITLTNFGEPFTDPGLEDKIAYANSQELSTYIISNASLFHLKSKSKDFLGLNKIEAAVKAGLSEIRLSFYGTKKSEYESIMNGGNFEQSIKNLSLLLAAKEKFGSLVKSSHWSQPIKSPEISVFFLDFNAVGEEMSSKGKEFVSFFSERADYLEVWKPHNFGMGKSYRALEGIKKSCGRPQSGPVQINWRGVVVPCCYDYNEEIPLGNVVNQTVEEVLRSEPYRKLRQIHEEASFKLQPYCDKCDQLCPHEDALLYSTHPAHFQMSRAAIMRTPNTRPKYSMRSQ